MIRQSVGRGGCNAAGDVMYVQLLLSDWLARQGQPALAIDGLCGPKTCDALLKFQRLSTGLSDGRADPGGPTIKALQHRHVEGLAGGFPGYALSPQQLSQCELPPRRISPAAMSQLVDGYFKKLRAGMD